MNTRARRQPSQNVLDWIEARKRFRLSRAQVQIARKLGMDPQKLGTLNNHDQEPWKAPPPRFIEHLYFKRFGKERPETLVSIDERAMLAHAKNAACRELRRTARGGAPPGGAA